MKVIAQSVTPEIKFYRGIGSNTVSAGSNYYTFSNDYNPNKAILQSYNFSRSINNLDGSFQVQIKESVTSSDNLFMDLVKPLDIVKIGETKDRIDFIGVVTAVSFGATAANNSKYLNVSGYSVEYLFNVFNISLDVTNMAYINNDRFNNEIITQLSKNQGEGALSIESALTTIYKYFVDMAKEYKGVSNIVMADLLDKEFGTAFSDKFNIGYLNNTKKQNDNNFYLPISSNIITGNTVNFMTYIKNLLPSPVYEIFSTINKNGKPKIIIRKIPFSNKDFAALKNTNIPPELVTDYTFTKNCENVYTAFFSYVEGSVKSADFYQKINATDQGYATARNEDKIHIYGYKPLTVNFIGFKNQSTDSGEEKVNQDITVKFNELDEDLKKWFGKLDEMYNGDVTIVNIISNDNPKIGETVTLCGGTFYVTEENHTWRFGSAGTINYKFERGGKYVDGEFHELTGISKPYSELFSEANS